MFKIKAELMGTVIKTDKGFIGQYLVTLADGKRDFIKVFSKTAEKLIPSGELVIKNDFFFAV